MAISLGKLHGSPRPEENADALDGLDTEEREAFNDFYREFVPRVAGYVRRHIHDHELIDEIVQETLLRAYRHGLHLEEGDEHWRWLATVARNLCIDQRALHRNWRESSVEEPETLDLTVYDFDPEAHVVAAERQEIVARALARLTERERRLLVQKHIEGRRVREMASHEGVHVEALKSALRRARKAFAESYAAINDRTGVASVFGPLVAGASLRLRELKARIGAMGDQVTTLAAHATTSAGFLNTATAAAVVVGLALGPGLSGLVPDGADAPGSAGDVAIGGAGADGARSLATPRLLGHVSDAPSGDRPSAQGTASGAAFPGGEYDTGGDDTTGSSPPSNDQPGDGPFGGPGPVAPPDEPDPDEAELDPVDLGPESVEEPEDAYITSVAVAPSSTPSGTDEGEDAPGSSSEPSPEAEAEHEEGGTSDDAASDSGDADDGAEEEQADGETGGTSEDDSDSDAGDADEGTDETGAEPDDDSESDADADGTDDSSADAEPREVPHVFALGEPRGDARYGCHTSVQCDEGSPVGPTACQVQCTVLFRSVDGGATWEKLPAKGLDAERIFVPPEYPEDPRIFAIGQLGLLISEDRGETFHPATSVPAKRYSFYDIAFWPGFGDGSEDRLVLSDVRSGVWVFDASTRAVAPLPLDKGLEVRGVRFGLNDDDEVGVLLTVTHDRLAVFRQNLDRTGVYFCTLVRCERHVDLPSGHARFVEAQSGSAGLDNALTVSYGSILFGSDDHGRSFSEYAVEESPRRGLGVVVVGGDHGWYTRSVELVQGPDHRSIAETAIYRSDDAGRVWREIGRSADVALGALTVLPSGRLIATGHLREEGSFWGNTILCSEDGGQTWERRCTAVPAR